MTEPVAPAVPVVGPADVGPLGLAPVTLPLTTIVPKAESAEFSLECEIEGLLLPVEGGLKNESGKFLIRNGTWSGLLASGLSTLSNKACKTISESRSSTILLFDN